MRIEVPPVKKEQWCLMMVQVSHQVFVIMSLRFVFGQCIEEEGDYSKEIFQPMSTQHSPHIILKVKKKRKHKASQLLASNLNLSSIGHNTI